MTMTTRRMRATGFIVAMAITLTACGGKPDEAAAVDDLDNQLTAAAQTSPARDPALQSALRDQIMVDPALTQQANDRSVRPPTMPASGAAAPDALASGAAEHDAVRPAPAAVNDCPKCRAARQALTLGALAASQGGGAATCANAIQYSATWANRLPAGVPLYPDARVGEAAGADGAGCALRVVSFASGAPIQWLLDWYYTKVTAAGFAVGHQVDGADHVLAGRRANGAAVLVAMRPRGGGGTDVDLMVDAGR